MWRRPWWLCALAIVALRCGGGDRTPGETGGTTGSSGTTTGTSGTATGTGGAAGTGTPVCGAPQTSCSLDSQCCDGH